MKMMQRILWLTLPLTLTWFAAMPAAHAKALKVVTTLPSLASIVAEVGGHDVDVSPMAAATEDAHFVDARPNLIVLLNRADLLVANGLELEIGWLPTLQVAARNGAIQTGGRGYLEAAQSVELLDVPTMRIDRSMGDLHPGGNPHFLNDPRRVAAVAMAVGQRLGVLDPHHAEAYQTRATAFATRMRTLADAQTKRFAALPAASRQVVTYHKSLTYLLDWLQLAEVSTLEPRPGVPPDPGHVSTVLTTMRAKNVRVVVQEEYYPSNTSRTVAKLAKGGLVVLHGGVRFNAQETYDAYFTHMCDDLFAALIGE